MIEGDDDVEVAQVKNGRRQNEDPNVDRLITILFMSHRIQAKLYKTDTLESFVDRVSPTSIPNPFLFSCALSFQMSAAQTGLVCTISSSCSKRMS